MATLILSDRIRMDERITIYSGPFVQGATAVVFAAYTHRFLASFYYGLTLPQYGFLFLPLVIAAILATLFAASLGRRCRAEWGYGFGLSCSLLGMALLIATEWVLRQPVTYPLLLASAAFVGAGLGLSFPYVRCYAISLKPLHTRRQILFVNALLTAGLAASPLYALATFGTSAWWSLPVLLEVLLIAQMLLSRSLSAPPDGAPPRRADRPVPARFHAYPGLALLYGLCAIALITAPRYLTGTVPSARHVHFMVLVEVAFWPALVQGCRVVFAIIDGMKSRQQVANIGVFMVGVIILVVSIAVSRYDLMHIGLYLLVVIGCAALLPMDTRPGNEYVAVFPLAVAAGLMALLPAGLGLSRFGYDIVTGIGVSSLEVFLGVALMGAVACILLLPIIMSWPTMGYFDKPAARSAGSPGTGHSGGAGIPGALSAPAPRIPSDHPQDGGGDREPGGATALPSRPQADSRRRNQ
jgi:MFS family permease